VGDLVGASIYGEISLHSAHMDGMIVKGRSVSNSGLNVDVLFGTVGF
jgi:hypothetical protein